MEKLPVLIVRRKFSSVTPVPSSLKMPSMQQRVIFECRERCAGGAHDVKLMYILPLPYLYQRCYELFYLWIWGALDCISPWLHQPLPAVQIQTSMSLCFHFIIPSTPILWRLHDIALHVYYVFLLQMDPEKVRLLQLTICESKHKYQHALRTSIQSCSDNKDGTTTGHGNGSCCDVSMFMSVLGWSVTLPFPLSHRSYHT